MTKRLEDRLLERWPIAKWDGLTVVVGCSGGADSTALVVALASLKSARTTIVVAHYNHRLRGHESDTDAAFVHQLAVDNGCLFVTNDRKIEPAQEERQHAPSDEATLREIRYRFLSQTANRIGARYVAVAHNADDRIETVLHQWCRGTGLAGLCGIKPFRDLDHDLVLARPLIDVWRSEILDYLGEKRQTFRIDSSNLSNAYTRNRIRNQLVPVIDEVIGPSARESISRNADILSEVWDYISQQSDKWLYKDADIQWNSNHHSLFVSIQRRGLIGTSWPVIHQSFVKIWNEKNWPLQGMTQFHWSEVRRFLNALTKEDCQNSDFNKLRLQLPGKIEMYCSDERIVLERRIDESAK